MYSFSKADLNIFGKGREWIAVNGSGGFAMQSLLGSNTRKYHGLLNSSFKGKHYSTLSNIDDSIEVDGIRFNLATHHFRNANTNGSEFLERVDVSTFPTFTYKAGDAIVKKTILMQRHANTTIINYKIFSKRQFVFEARPLVNIRGCDSVNLNPEFEVEKLSSGISVKGQNSSLTLKIISEIGFKENPVRWNDFYFKEEEERGYPASEAALCVGSFTSEKNEFSIFATTEENGDIEDFKNARKKEEKRIEALLSGQHSPRNVVERRLLEELVLASDKYITSNAQDEVRVIAGFPWFAKQWGRDALISMPGLMLCTKRFEDARNFLKAISKSCVGGEIPNYENGEKNFNSVDASLWFFIAAYKYYQYTSDSRFIERHAWVTMKDILSKYEKKEHAIGLIENGDAMTWMDAMVNGRAVTPRRIAVEINALYYNALKIAAFFAETFFEGELSKHYAKKAEVVKRKLDEFLWNKQFNYLNDCLSDDAIRPNQLIAISLPFPIVSPEKQARILSIFEKQLLTLKGAYTLSPENSKFKGEYKGSQAERDAAYHNGTVWPFLVGAYVSTKLRIENDERAREFCENLTDSLKTELTRRGIGGISEVYSPKTGEPNGCPFQAWSVAEVLRCFYEDILDLKPIAMQGEL